MGNLLVYKNRIPSGTSTTIPDWTRPSDWLPMPTIGTQEFIGLLAITDDESNHIALSCAGNYTVDWGDGNIENFSTGVKANHTYTYSGISDTTISTRGYKQVLVRVTPQAGQNLTTINLQQQNSILAKAHITGWLDISINGANITSLPLGGGTVTQGMCERVVLGTLGSITSFSNLFAFFYALQSVSISTSSTVTSFVNTFYSCLSLRTIPLINTSAGTNFTQMFQACVSLITIPLINTSAGTSFAGFFHTCSSLKSLPLLNLSNGTNFDGAFQSCTSMPFYPLFDTSKGTIFQQMFYLNTSLQQLPNLNTALGGNFANMLNSVPSLAKGAFQGTRYSISYQNMCLSRNAVVDIFNGLGTAVGAQTITITTNPAFSAIPLNALPAQLLLGATVVPSTQDVYASAQNGYIYKQTGGSGSFVIDSAIDTWHQGMGVDIYNNVYCAIAAGGSAGYKKKTAGSGSWASVAVTGVGQPNSIAGDFLGNLYIGSSTGLYKQTALTGSFVQVYSGSVSSFDISPFDGSIYIVSSGTIYKQTAGTGSFDSVQTLSNSVVVCMPNGDAYATNGTLYKQTAGTGSFVSMGVLTNAGTNIARQIVDKADGTLFTAAYGQDVFSLDFNNVVTPTDRLIAINKGWTIA